MDVYFKDAEGKAIKQVTKDNLDDFKKFLQTVDSRDNIVIRQNYSNIQFAEDLSFDDITKNENGTPIPMPENVQKAVGEMMTSSPHFKELAADAIDAADAYPRIISTMYRRAGEAIGSGTYYEFIRNTIAQRPLSENLAVIDALVTDTNGFGLHNLGQTDKAVKSLSGSQKKHLEHIFQLSQKAKNAYSQEQYKYIPAQEAIQQMAQRDTFINVPLPKEMRDAFNDSYLGKVPGSGREFLFHRVATLDKKYFRPEDVSAVVASGAYSMTPQTNKDTSAAKTQAQKNVNILPDHYKKVKELIMEMAEKENSYIPGTRGETKSLVQKVQDVAVKLYNIDFDLMKLKNMSVYRSKATDWKSLPDTFKTGVMHDVMMEAAQKEIINGNAAKLDKETLQMVLNNDKNAYYSEMLPDDVIKNVQLSQKQAVKRQVRQAKDTYSFNVYSSVLSTKEKAEMLDNIEKNLQPQFERKPQLEQEKAEYQRRWDEVQQSYQEFSKAHDTTSRIANLQKAYQDIVSCFKNGEPNKHEICLTRQEVEKVISSVLDGQHAFVDTPDQGSLPIFGRGSEKERRISLANAIRAFNNEINRPNDDIKAFSGRLLTAEALQEAQQKEAELKQNSTTLQNKWQNDYSSAKYANYTRDMNDLTTINHQEKELQKGRAVVQKLLNDVRKKAKDAVGVPETSPLQAVTADMDKDTKASVRQQNKSVKDKIEEKSTTLEIRKMATQQYADIHGRTPNTQQLDEYITLLDREFNSANRNAAHPQTDMKAYLKNRRKVIDASQQNNQKLSDDTIGAVMYHNIHTPKAKKAQKAQRRSTGNQETR